MQWRWFKKKKTKQKVPKFARPIEPRIYSVKCFSVMVGEIASIIVELDATG